MSTSSSPRGSATPILWCLSAAGLFGASTPASKLLLDGAVGPLTLAGLLYLGAVLATATGIFDHLPYENTPLIGLIEQHQKPAFLTTALALTAAGWCAWGRRKGEDPIGSVPHLALLVAVGMLVVYTGLEGGELVYEHAIGVKDR